jgi:hypothetical protein
MGRGKRLAQNTGVECINAFIRQAGNSFISAVISGYGVDRFEFFHFGIIRDNGNLASVLQRAKLIEHFRIEDFTEMLKPESFFYASLLIRTHVVSLVPHA